MPPRPCRAVLALTAAAALHLAPSASAAPTTGSANKPDPKASKPDPKTATKPDPKASKSDKSSATKPDPKASKTDPKPDKSAAKPDPKASKPDPKTSGNNFLRLQPSNGSAESARSASGVSLSGYQALELRINLNGATLGGGDQSAWYMNQGTGWKWVVLANYVTQRSTAWQTIRVPLSSFSGFNPSAPFGNMGFRFWSATPITVDIDDIKFVR